MIMRFFRLALFVPILLVTSCGRPTSSTIVPASTTKSPHALNPGIDGGFGASEAAKVRAADFSILFVGNSHTSSEDLPNLVADLIPFVHPKKTVHHHLVSVGFLEDAANNPHCLEEIDSRPWKCVILQAQKISMSGQFEYSRQEGIDLAKRAKDKGANVFFYSEWGRKGVEEEGPRTQRIYEEMAEAAGVRVAPVGRAWDLALAARPELVLHASDGNHQSALGAFLTALVLFGRITGESPEPLIAFPYPNTDEPLRKLLVDAAMQALREKSLPR